MIPVRCCKKEVPLDYIKESLNAPEFEQYNQFLKERLKKGLGKKKVCQEYRRTIEEQGAKICRECHRGIIRNEGCKHITCKCGHQFCWECGANWKHGHLDIQNCIAAVESEQDDSDSDTESEHFDPVTEEIEAETEESPTPMMTKWRVFTRKMSRTLLWRTFKRKMARLSKWRAL